MLRKNIEEMPVNVLSTLIDRFWCRIRVLKLGVTIAHGARYVAPWYRDRYSLWVNLHLTKRALLLGSIMVKATLLRTHH